MATHEEETTLDAEARVALARSQLDDLAVAVESHGTSLGMLLESLMSLVERHQQEALALQHAQLDGAVELVGDHQTMLRFREPLSLLCQFPDRLRQRLEHVRAALAPLPATPPSPDQLAGEVLTLFPFDEERAANAALAGVEPPFDEDTSLDLEIF